MDRERLVTAAVDLLRGRETLDAATLAARLDASLFDPDASPDEREATVAVVLANGDRCAHLPRSRFADLEVLTEGLTLTHRITAREIEIEGLDIEPDLGALTFGRDELIPLERHGWASPIYPSALVDDDDGVDVAEHGSLFGPRGWLSGFAPGDLLAFTLRDGSLGVRVVDEPTDAASSRATEALRTAWNAWRESEPGVFIPDAVFAVLDQTDDVFRTPAAPVSELAGRAGLVVDIDRLEHPDDVHDDLFALIADRYDLDDCCLESLFACVAVAGVLGEGDQPSPKGARKIADELAHGGVAPILFDLFAGADDDERRALDVLVGATERHARGRGRAAVRYLRSLLLERDGDAVGAEHLCLDAISDDPGYVPALQALAAFAEDRGDAARAISYRSRVDPDDPRIERLRSFLPAATKVGRNERCPCGSGRKFKSCCAGARPPLVERARWLLERAAIWAGEPGRSGLVDELMGVRMGTDDPDEDEALDPAVIEFALFEEGMLETYLLARDSMLPSDELALARSWTGSKRNAWEVASTGTGVVDLVDMRSGDHVLVADDTASRTLHPGDWVWARVASGGGGSLIFVGYPNLVPMRARHSLLELMDTDPSGFEMAAWLAACETLTVTTREGQPIVLCEARYRLPDPDEAGTALAAQLDPAGEGRCVEHVEIEGDKIVRGFIDIDGDVATITTNAVERLERLRAILLDAAPGAVLSDEQRTPADELIARARSGELETEDKKPDDLPPEARAQLEQLMEAEMDRLERRWVDESVPALGGLTPRQALDDPTRRDDLVQLLREFDAASASRRPSHAIGRAMDPDKLRALLGLA